jgi:aerobic-type carbon monoxide dehydrogenase small subunit (CoxS/CutS family)
MELVINGERRKVDADPTRTLLSVLRDDLGLTGTKYGCGESQCGACTVLVDGRARRACVTRLDALRGSEVRTIEGLAEGGELHPLQQAFLDEGAMQCGFCIPGMVMSAAGLLATQPQPTEAEIVTAMGGNICRCGVYPRIVRAIRAAAAALKGRKR